MSDTLTLVSAGPAGQGNNASYEPSLSADGTKVAFWSYASDLVAGDTNGTADVFVKDLATGTVTLVSTGAGVQGNGGSYRPSISADGTKVTFDSEASNLIANDANSGVQDVFVKDLMTGALTLVSAGAGVQGNGGSFTPSISADGTKIVFHSQSSNLGNANGVANVFVKDLATDALTLVSTGVGLPAGHWSGAPSISGDGTKVAFQSKPSTSLLGTDVFVKDLATGTLTLISAGSNGRGNGESENPSFSTDGTKLAFQSRASDLVANDTNDRADVFVEDLATGALTLVSVGSNGQGNGWSFNPSLSGDGTKVTFGSDAANLVAGDANGHTDVFLKDLATGGLTLVSTSMGSQGNAGSNFPSLSADGTNVAFETYASNFVASDLNGASADVFVKHARPVPFLAYDSFVVNDGGWINNETYPRELGDVNGDGRADIVGFGYSGVWIALGKSDGTFNQDKLDLREFGNAQGWNSKNLYPRELGDVNGDGHADIVGFGQQGVQVALGNSSGGFGAPGFVLGAFGVDPSAGGWLSNNEYPREVGDVNGDGYADIVGFANDGVQVALGNSSGGFGAPGFVLGAFGTNAGGWSNNDLFPRKLGDVNGDGYADIVGFANDGVQVALGNSSGGFRAPGFVLGFFGVDRSAGGWLNNNEYPREVGDVNGDGRADIVGFANGGVFVAAGNASGAFNTPQVTLRDFGINAGGWSDIDRYPRELADVDGDRIADIVGFKDDGVYVALGTASGSFI